ncbi:DNA-binding protein [Candidatus Geothermarchaeota archaeon]|nr:MAG: DNA-binding protein [Candidatus Geothermarchaeota archaeon]RLG62459.1 MAG: DNA-binding protein [Candidatus Geothermarchaeota archaeon]HEW93997.1 HEPN domain-containing protein [Thermoprotei archaeon]
MKDRRSERYKRWLSLAKEDLKFAKYALDLNSFSISAFHSHQAAEKALKGLIEYIGDIPEKTHVLTELIEQLRINGHEVPERILRNCIELEPHYSTSRYPDLGPDPLKYYNKWLAEKLYKYAEEVVKYVEEMG